MYVQSFHVNLDTIRPRAHTTGFFLVECCAMRCDTDTLGQTMECDARSAMAKEAKNSAQEMASVHVYGRDVSPRLFFGPVSLSPKVGIRLGRALSVRDGDDAAAPSQRVGMKRSRRHRRISPRPRRRSDASSAPSASVRFAPYVCKNRRRHQADRTRTSVVYFHFVVRIDVAAAVRLLRRMAPVFFVCFVQPLLVTAAIVFLLFSVAVSSRIRKSVDQWRHATFPRTTAGPAPARPTKLWMTDFCVDPVADSSTTVSLSFLALRSEFRPCCNSASTDCPPPPSTSTAAGRSLIRLRMACPKVAARGLFFLHEPFRNRRIDRFRTRFSRLHNEIVGRSFFCS